MNFKRIELIFFIAFVALDIFLFISYSQKDDTVISTSNSTSEDSLSSVLKSIRDDQISYGRLSSKKGNGYYIASPVRNDLQLNLDALQNQTATYENHKIVSTFENPIKIKESNRPQDTLNSIVDDSTKIVDGKEYKYDRSLSTRTTVVYTQTIHGIPVYLTSGQLRFSIRSGYAIEYTQGILENIEILHDQKPIISQERAVIWLYQYNKLMNDSTVEWVNLGYTKLLAVNNNVVYIPTWVIAVKSNSTGNIQYRRINAFSGAIMDESSSMD
ncbi:two-component system regulatory protein YycI [Liquorilactobacillus cacaonum]|uniref:YycH family protein n=1 Tax=Liquorilactobacillus cacaonum DSM 21116 TaxID=1423729 RepID=A0A0R2CM45_9LACO|nr:two-component system regulatory protein YycI [Liquorilactobacillus cacaonum]KRM92671.1 YycH family protein [Liquorilactobacillus cacaonum DSM 21116]